MAVTATASLALPAITPHRPHTGTHILQGTYDGAGLSASGSGMLLLAKIPPDALVTVVEEHSTGAATQVYNVGIRAEAGSLSASALTSLKAGGTAGQSVQHGPYQCVREETTNESFKYVTATLQSGTVTASTAIRYLVIYSVAGGQ